MCPAVETYKYGGSDTEGPDQGTPAANDQEAKWWNTEPPAIAAEARSEAEWWQAIEASILVDRLEPNGEIQAACMQSELLGEALTGAGDQGIWSSSEGE